MSKTRAFMALSIACAAHALAAGANPGFLVADCPAVSERPTIDGFLNDACWALAGRLMGFTQAGSDAPVECQTEVAVVCDKANLYIAVRAEEPRPDSLVGKRHGRDLDIANNDTVGISIRPNSQDRNTFHLLINSAGAIADRRGRDTAWNAELQARTIVADTHWRTELAVSFRCLEVKFADGMILGVNFRRNDRVRDVRSAWAPGKRGYLLAGNVFTSQADGRPQTCGPLTIETGAHKITFFGNAAATARLLEDLSPRVEGLRRDAGALPKGAFEAASVRKQVLAMVSEYEAARTAAYETIPDVLAQGAAAVPATALALGQRLDALSVRVAELEPAVRLSAVFAK